jgi:hypothetical protein
MKIMGNPAVSGGFTELVRNSFEIKEIKLES